MDSAASKAIKYLIDEIESSIKSITDEKIKHQNGAYKYKKLNLYLSAIATILLGLNYDTFNVLDFNFQPWALNLAFMVNAILALVNSLNTYHSYHELYAINTTTANKLHLLQSDISYYSNNDKQVDEKELNDFRKKFTKILEEKYQAIEKTLKGKLEQG